MRKHIAILIASFAILNVSCEEKEWLGGWESHDVYLLQTDELVPAHGYTVDVPSEAGSVELQVVALKITGIRVLSKADALSVESLTDCTSEDAVVYDYLTGYSDGEARQYPRYVQTIRISVDANKGKRSRTMRFRLVTASGYPECADMTVRQAGK